MRSIGFLALVHALVATVDALLPARAASLTQADRPNGGHRAPAALMQADRPNDWYYDNVEFMNEPFKFIAEHPQDFSPAMQAMAKYQFITAEDSRPLGDLPMYWNEGDQLRQSLLQKSRVADDLARVIMTADLETMGKLAADAKFAEKKECPTRTHRETLDFDSTLGWMSVRSSSSVLRGCQRTTAACSPFTRRSRG